MSPPHDGQCAGAGSDVHEQPVRSAVARAARHGRAQQTEAQRLDQARMGSGRRADPLVLLHHRALRQGHHELLFAVGRQPAPHPVHLRFVHAERHGLVHLPADHLVQVRRTGRHLGEPHQRHLRGAVRQQQRDPPRTPRKPAEHVVESVRQRGRIREVGAVHGRRHDLRRQCGSRMTAHQRSMATGLDLYRGDPSGGDRHRRRRTRRREQRVQQASRQRR